MVGVETVAPAQTQTKMVVAFEDLFEYAKTGNKEKMQEFLEDKLGKKLVNLTDKLKRTPLVMAAHQGHDDCVELLLEAGADWKKEAFHAFLPMHFAAQSGHLGCLKLLVGHISKSDDEKHGQVKRALARTCGGKSREKGGKTALHLACAKGHKECIDFLLMKGANPEQKMPGTGQLAEQLVPQENVELVEAVREIFARYETKKEAKVQARFKRAGIAAPPPAKSKNKEKDSPKSPRKASDKKKSPSPSRRSRSRSPRKHDAGAASSSPKSKKDEEKDKEKDKKKKAAFGLESVLGNLGEQGFGQFEFQKF